MEVLHATAHTLDRALDAAGAASFELDVTTRRLRWDTGAQALLGAVPATYGAWLARLDPAGRRRLRDAIRGAVRNEAVLDVVIQWRGDRSRDLRVRCAVEPQFDGRVMGLIMAMSDLARDRVDGAEGPSDALGRANSRPLADAPVRVRPRCAEVFDVAALIAQSGFDAYRRAKARDLDVLVDLPGEIPRRSLGDPSLLRESLDRCLADAIERTEAGWVELRARHDAAAGRLQLTVEDTGGPALVDADSWGVRVSMDLPCPAANDRSYPLLGHGRHALLVCERRRTAEVLLARMDEIGLRTTLRSDPLAATRAFASMEHLDVVVLEPHLEGVDVGELAACWRHARPEIPIVYARPHAVADTSMPMASLTYPWTAESVARALGPLLGPARPAPRRRA